jgi:hypothetical protein
MRPKGTKREPFLEMLVGSGAEQEEESAWRSQVGNKFSHSDDTKALSMQQIVLPLT